MARLTAAERAVLRKIQSRGGRNSAKRRKLDPEALAAQMRKAANARWNRETTAPEAQLGES